MPQHKDGAGAFYIPERPAPGGRSGCSSGSPVHGWSVTQYHCHRYDKGHRWFYTGHTCQHFQFCGLSSGISLCALLSLGLLGWSCGHDGNCNFRTAEFFLKQVDKEVHDAHPAEPGQTWADPRRVPLGHARGEVLLPGGFCRGCSLQGQGGGAGLAAPQTHRAAADQLCRELVWLAGHVGCTHVVYSCESPGESYRGPSFRNARLDEHFDQCSAGIARTACEMGGCACEPRAPREFVPGGHWP
mmetsp:Transcript_18996/g.35328  ORF Transcript_18996/g.35328 Transcript_18996/m.35328 type:complete len:243 (-) Transcript_18996:536-1264(-)